MDEMNEVVAQFMKETGVTDTSNHAGVQRDFKDGRPGHTYDRPSALLKKFADWSILKYLTDGEL